MVNRNALIRGGAGNTTWSKVVLNTISEDRPGAMLSLTYCLQLEY